MAVLGDMIVRIKGDNKELNKALTDSEQKQKKFTKFLKGALGVGGAILAYKALTGIVKDLVGAYSIQEEAETKLRSAIRATGKEALISVDALFEYASELQSVTTFGDEATISALALLQQLADLDEEGLKKVIPGIQDMALALGVDLETAASLVGKTLGSSTNALSRYGIVLDATAPKEEKLIQLTEELDKKFGGLSRDLALTGTGALKQFNNVLGDIKEEGGKALLEVLGPIIRDMTDFLSKTLQNIRSTQILNRVLDKQAGTVREVDKAIEIQNQRLDDAREKEQLLGEEIEELRIKSMTGGRLQIQQAGHDLEMKKLSLAATGKAIEKGEENLIFLAKERIAVAELEKIKSADVTITEAQVDATDEDTEAIDKNIEAIIRQTDAAVEYHQLRLDAETAMTIELKRINEERELEEERAADEIFRMRKQLLDDSLSYTTQISGALSGIWANYYAGLLQDEELTEDERKKIQRKAAITAKKFALFEATITGFQAIVSGYSSKPFLPVGLAMGALASVLTGLRIAAIAKQPIPALAEGGLVMPSAGGSPVIMAEAGVPEFAVPDRPDVMGLLADRISQAIQSPINNINVSSPSFPSQITIRIGDRDFTGFIQNKIDNQDLLVPQGNII